MTATVTMTSAEVGKLIDNARAAYDEQWLAGLEWDSNKEAYRIDNNANYDETMSGCWMDDNGQLWLSGDNHAEDRRDYVMDVLKSKGLDSEAYDAWCNNFNGYEADMWGVTA